ncbi:ChaB family protein [Streptomyces sp. NPDC049577]|uniref:ChaB family protein n=1 Tax=Streptomyces sp. NPDC049577 TaxID=3155153 RepID=UPI003439C80B
MPGREELPDTLRRSDAKARRTWIKAHDSAVEQYGEGERAHRVAYGALKHTHEKVGDHWQPKEHGRKGPSDEQSRRPRGTSDASAEGVDTRASKRHLQEVARELDIHGRSTMDKGELVDAIRKANERATAAARR